MFEPLLVRNFSIEEDWYVVRQILEDANPVGEKSHRVRFTIYWPDRTEIYEAPCKLEGEDTPDRWDWGNQLPPLKPKNIDKEESTDGIILPEGKETDIPMVRSTAHGIGRSQIVAAVLPEELWTGNNVAYKQLQHMLLENAWTDTGSVAGMIQKIFTPREPSPANDPTRVIPTISEEEIKNKIGNPYLLIGEKFEMVESSGGAIGSLTEQLDKIETQIKDLVSMSFASVEPATIAQSGESKKVDRIQLDDTLRQYGAIIVKIYQQCLDVLVKITAQSLNLSVSGLDNYQVDTLEEILDKTQNLIANRAIIPATALKIWAQKLTFEMIGTVDPDTRKLIEKELEAIDYTKFGEIEDNKASNSTV
jgi:hypothetical protein